MTLLTDLYQLTMAYGYWKVGMSGRRAVFHLVFRRNPFGGGFSIACGLHQAIEYLRDLRFEADDLAYLASLRGRDDRPLFDPGFLDHLRTWSLTCDIDAVPEGTVVFPNEPLVRVNGPIEQAQIVETALLNLINFQTLIATKAARVCLAARGEPVIEFGLRRAQGIDGGLSASRAAYVGGCVATSNVLAGRIHGIPVRGTHAHSWVMAFDSEIQAFEAYAGAMPNNCVFLVDTYNTLEGVEKAIRVGKQLREAGHEMIGIRLDSGDLAYLSIEARRKLDAAGFAEASILASNDLDETVINSLKDQNAKIDAWGVGTKLATAYDQPALGGVYKLSAIEDEHGRMQPRLKLSEQAAKISTPGILQVRRFRRGGECVADAIWDEMIGLHEPMQIVDPLDSTRRRPVEADLKHEDLLVPIFRGGTCVYEPPDIHVVRRRVQDQLAGFHGGIKRFVNPHQYPVGLEQNLHELRTRLILEAREQVRRSGAPASESSSWPTMP